MSGHEDEYEAYWAGSSDEEERYRDSHEEHDDLDLCNTSACPGTCVPQCGWCVAAHSCPDDCRGGACPYEALTAAENARHTTSTIEAPSVTLEELQATLDELGIEDASPPTMLMPPLTLAPRPWPARWTQENIADALRPAPIPGFNSEYNQRPTTTDED